ncbi:MAG TPA: COX15/CtaA family protein [Chitinophagaceae bacterium]|nr:COX15/CtaA family protein [Chitinophagaceae bacterium]
MNVRLDDTRGSRTVAIWLLVGVGMIIVQIALGGITRLTGSGLSITEWNVITGTLPPLNHRQWMEAFDKYRQTPQFQLLNFDFTLRDFRFIFFWEWFHRLWARLMGVVFFIPFVLFLIRGRFRAEMVRPLAILFLLGALQGAVGWIMVASGLTGDAIYVKPTRLALHFIFALGLLSYTFWFALKLLVGRDRTVAGSFRLRRVTWLIAGVLVLQLLYGALMAGHKAATAAPTWPDINGSLLPAGLLAAPAGWMNLLENKITIHFVHRGLAYLILALIIWWTIRAVHIAPGNDLLRRTRFLPLSIAGTQVLLGILAVLVSPQIVPGHWGLFEWIAQLHQLTAMLLLLSLVWMLYLLREPVPSQPA